MAHSTYKFSLSYCLQSLSLRHFVPAGISAQANPAGVATLRERSTVLSKVSGT